MFDDFYMTQYKNSVITTSGDVLMTFDFIVLKMNMNSIIQWHTAICNKESRLSSRCIFP